MAQISRSVFVQTLDYFLAPIRRFLEDDDVEEIMINGPREIYIEKRGIGLQKCPEIRFDSAERLEAAAKNIAQSAGVMVRSDSPRFDARLPGGHRAHVILPPLCRNGISVTIRKHKGNPLTLQDLLDRDTLTQEAAQFLRLAVRCQQNILVSGGTGTGKTTLLNALSSFIPENQRIIVIEDTSELRLQQEHVLSLQSRPPDRKGHGEVTIRDLLHSSLRMRPDRILIGECRGGEALDLLQALNTGHGGSMSTVHANAPKEALQRLETLALFGFGGADFPVAFLRAQVSSAIQIVVQLRRLGTRRMVEQIAANQPGDDPMEYSLSQLFIADYSGHKPSLHPTPILKDYVKRLSPATIG